MRILIVEDEEKIANSLKKGLQNENFTVDIANDGQKGLNMATSEEYDTIVLDLMIPIIDGVNVLRSLREKNIFTPVIILTAKDSVDDKVNGLNVGADDYLAKPFSFDELLARVRSLIRRSTNKQSVLEIENLILDPSTHTAKRNDKSLNLSAKEFAILEYLMRNSDIVVSETKIISHVWDYDFDSMSNVVAVHIRNLRQKIDKGFPKEKKLIHTMRGFGYIISGKDEYQNI